MLKAMYPCVMFYDYHYDYLETDMLWKQIYYYITDTIVKHYDIQYIKIHYQPIMKTHNALWIY